ncbi:hypothetical protein GIB67_025716 [Kingdonia uniflora]|uniref:K+ potassium transporter C-terminal domain-containing protein n=1 Tax=Kingdonia uniflora TaxID=39325 RepID=A0A7J7KW60_9MAGN|nr:hypothetical protein GIB67_025716 [Kingdonia uniflora]
MVEGGDGDETKEEMVEREVKIVEQGLRSGVVHLMGESEVVANKGASLIKKVMINYAYNFMRRNLRQSNKVCDIPHGRLLKVGLAYEL